MFKLVPNGRFNSRGNGRSAGPRVDAMRLTNVAMVPTPIRNAWLPETMQEQTFDSPSNSHFQGLEQIRR